MKTIEDFDVIEGVPPVFSPESWVSVDIECFKMDGKRLHRPTGYFASCSFTCDGQTAYVVTDLEQLKAAEQSIWNCGLVFMNMAFDVRHLRRWITLLSRRNVRDIMLTESILYGGYYSRFSLRDLTRRYLHAYMQKETRSQYEKADEVTPEMILYNARDAIVQWRVDREQMKIAKNGFAKVWYEIDLPASWAFLEFKGVPLDQKKWKEIAEKNTEMSKELKETFPFNPNSPAQVLKHLKEVEKLDIKETGAETLNPYVGKNETVSRLMQYRTVDKRRSTYGLSWLNAHLEPDGKIYTSINVIGAKDTGRTSSDSPNLQNIPVRDSPEFRECFISSPRHVLVGGDFGQQEIRVAAYESQDRKLLALLASDQDIYCGVASDIHERVITKADKKERQDAKGVALGAIYGLTAIGLAIKLTNERKEKVTRNEAQDLLDLFFSKFPELARWCDKQRMRVQKGFVKTPDGRTCWINPYSYQAENNALNAPCQGGGAGMMKYSVRLLWERWDRRLEPFPAILQVHDEVILEPLIENCGYAEDLLRKCMIEAGEFVIPGVPVSVDVHTGRTWAEIH